MAATKKNMEIQYNKKIISDEIRSIRAKSRGAAERIPPAVINGDVRLASVWRDLAERVYSRQHDAATRGLSLQKLKALSREEERQLAFLENPHFE